MQQSAILNQTPERNNVMRNSLNHKYISQLMCALLFLTLNQIAQGNSAQTTQSQPDIASKLKQLAESIESLSQTVVDK